MAFFADVDGKDVLVSLEDKKPSQQLIMQLGESELDFTPHLAYNFRYMYILLCHVFH